MKKHFYLAIMISIILGLYIPKDLQFAVTIMIISSVVTYIGLNHEEFFPAKGGDDNE
ncbi:hypothetical protein LOX61_01385 [Latilactobacillus curvatus]|uniref:hypothetical protein n=1 Tax=Latilactobacillus curvatus TaxID=28038 RepID=UPI0020C74C42|nr:hypothetical protein [Latilactobacillus curvatus]MCP8849155.1 hypothetical protein [Latilactobacillus curvatus]